MSQTEVQLIKNGAVVDADINGMSSSKLSGALPAISGASLTNLPTPTGKTRNLIINGAMQVAQRGSSSTIDGYGSIDRFRSNLAGCDENPTQSQSDVASGTTPYTLGFRKAFKFTNGNQTSGAGTTDCVAILHRIEAQDIASSGWNYTDSNSKITLSFWCKSSVAQNFFGFFRTQDGTAQLNAFETGSLTADTWTKVTKTITGDSNLQFDSNNDTGLDIEFTMFRGTDRTGTLTLNQWAAYNTNVRVPDMTSTWYTTNDATFEITGVQLEVGSVATDFEHRSFAEELALCQRYYYLHAAGTGMGGNSGETTISENATMYASNNMFCSIKFPTQMRAKPTLEVVTGSNYYISFSDGSSRGNFTGSGTALNSATSFNMAAINNSDTGSSSSGYTAIWRTSNAAAKIAFTAEL